MLVEQSYRVRWTEEGQEHQAPAAECVRCAQERMAELGKREGVSDVRANRVTPLPDWCDKH